MRVAHAAVDVLQCLSGVGDGQVSVHHKPQATGSLVVVETVLAGLEGHEALFPEDRQAAKDHRLAGREAETGRQADRQRQAETGRQAGRDRAGL